MAEPTTTWNSNPVPTHTGKSRSQAGTRRDHGRTRARTSTTATSWTTAITAFPATHSLLWSWERSVTPTGRSSVQTNFRNR